MSRQTGVSLAAQELAGAGAADEFSTIDDGAAAVEYGLGRAFNADALEHGIVHAHVVRFCANDFFVMWVEDHQVCVGADCAVAFAWIKMKEFFGFVRVELVGTLLRRMLAVDS